MPVPSAHDSPEQEHEVTTLELFFDLVFVFAMSQLSHHLLADLSWRAAGETLVMLVAIFTVWFRTSWSATIIPADQSRTFWLMLAVMLLGLFMNASVTGAFTISGWAFVIPYLLIQLGRALWAYFNAPDAAYREHYVRVLIWLIPTFPLWIAGAAANSDVRLLLWGLAAGIDLLGSWLAHPVPGRRLHSESMSFDASHMLERCRLLLLIALGETILTTGGAIAESPVLLITIVTGTAAFVGTIALWALTFKHSQRVLTSRFRHETVDPIRISRYTVNALIGLIAGLIAIAVGNELVIAHPEGEPSIALNLLLFGGPILYLLTQSWFLQAVPQDSMRLRLIGSAVLAVAGFVLLTAPPYIALILAAAILTALTLLDQRTTKPVQVQQLEESHHE